MYDIMCRIKNSYSVRIQSSHRIWLFQIFQFLFIDVHKEDCGHRKGSALCNRDGPPYGGESEKLCQNGCDRQDDQELAGQGNDHAVDCGSQCLKDGTDDNAVPGEQEAQADDAEGRDSDFQHLFRGVENTEKHVRNNPEQRDAEEHDCHGDGNTQFDCVCDPLSPARAVIVGDDRDKAVVQTEDRHEDEAVQLEVDAEHSRCRGGKGHQNLVHSEGHHGTD